MSGRMVADSDPQARQDAGDRGIAQRIAAFGLGPLVNLLTPFLVLPVLARATDAVGWAELAIGQSAGSVAAALVAFGWQITGPSEVAKARPADVGRIYAESLWTRLLLLVPVVGLAAGACWVRAPEQHPYLAAAIASSVALMGLAPTWVAIGLGRARSIVVFETVPRALLLAAAAVAIALGGALALYPVAMAASTLVALVLFSTRTVRPSRLTAPWSTSVRRLRALLPAALAIAASSIYSAGALFLVGTVADVQTSADMASADRLYRIGLVTIAVLANALQAWVVHGDPAVRRTRRRAALRLHLGLGVAGFAGFALCCRPVSRVFFGADVTPSLGVALCYGLTFLCVSVQVCLIQHVLVPDGHARLVLVAALAGCAVGVPALLVLGTQGPEGGSLGLLVGEAMVLGVQAVAARRSWRSSRWEGESEHARAQG